MRVASICSAVGFSRAATAVSGAAYVDKKKRHAVAAGPASPIYNLLNYQPQIWGLLRSSTVVGST